MPGIKLTNAEGVLPGGINVRGFIVAPGSRRSDGKFWRAPGFREAFKTGNIPVIPDWLALLIQPPEQKTESKQQTNGAASETPHADPADEPLVREALKFIPAGDRNSN
jgi:hypothetical protein